MDGDDNGCGGDDNSKNKEVIFCLTGGTSNPSLRKFYFTCPSGDLPGWKSALLDNRYHSLLEEKDSLKGVCGTFGAQLEEVAGMIDEAEEKMSPGEVDTFKGAVGEAGTEHAEDKTGENAGVGMPKDAQWVNSWARKLPGAMIIKPVHLTSMDREMLALTGKQ